MTSSARCGAKSSKVRSIDRNFLLHIALICVQMATLISLSAELSRSSPLHRNIDVPVPFANSRRLRSALSCRLTIHTVTPPHRCQIPLPSSVDEWENTDNFVCAGKRFKTADWRKTQAVKLTDHFSSSYLCPTHCECSLIAPLGSTHAPGITLAFSYIGISKLSCRACMLQPPRRAVVFHAGHPRYMVLAVGRAGPGPVSR